MAKRCRGAGVVALLLCSIIAIWHGIDSTRDRRPAARDLAQESATAEALVPPLLRSIFVCISLHFDVQRLAYLKLTLMTLAAYPTSVKICILCDDPEILRTVLSHWRFSRVRLCQDRDAPVALMRDDRRWAVTLQHHKAFELAVQEDYTAFVLLEDDLSLSWPALLSWASDTAILEANKFQRCFYRTEFREEDGAAVILDQLFYHPYKSWPRRVEVNLPKSQRCRLVKGRESAAADNRTAAAASAQLMRMQEVPPGCAHSEYVQMESTYQGFWVASRQKLLKYMDSSWWDVNNLLAAHGNIIDNWGVPERANGAIQMVDRPESWDSSCLVPHFPAQKVLAPIAMVEHDRIRYSTNPREPLGKILLTELFSGGPQTQNRH